MEFARVWRKAAALLLALVLCVGALAGLADTVVTPSEPEEEQEGWAKLEGDRVEDSLLALVLALAGEKGEIYVLTDEPVRLKNAQANLLAQITFLPDPENFPGKDWAARVTAEKPASGKELEDIDLSSYKDEEDDVLITVYVWVEEQTEPEPTPTPEPTAEPTPEPTAEPIPEPTPVPVEIAVTAENVVQGEWSNAVPVFTLAGIPEGSDGLTYAVILFDARIEDVEGTAYTYEEEGVSSLRFAILDEVGDIVSASAQYTLRLDLTAPEVDAAPSESKSYTLTVTASDALSGVDGVSVDGGETWEALADGETWAYKAGKATTIAAGQLQVRDAAGNVWQSGEDIQLKAVDKSHGGGGGGGGKKKDHSSNSSGNDGKTNYAAAALTASEEPVSALTAKERTLTLTATVDGTELEALFTEAFTRWAPEEADGKAFGAAALHTGDITDADDALVLTALPPETVSEDAPVPLYTWRFDGALLRTLYSSGVDLLILRVGDDIAVLPTAGFTAGTRYTELKIEGVSSRKFAYQAAMELLPPPEEGEARSFPEGNWTDDCVFTLTVDIEDQDEQWQLFPHDSEEMYAEDVFCAPVEAMEYPLGLYPPEEDAAENG